MTADSASSPRLAIARFLYDNYRPAGALTLRWEDATQVPIVLEHWLARADEVLAALPSVPRVEAPTSKLADAAKALLARMRWHADGSLQFAPEREAFEALRTALDFEDPRTDVAPPAPSEENSVKKILFTHDMILESAIMEAIPVENQGQAEDGIPYATHRGILRIGGLELEVFTLNTGVRVISEESALAFFKALEGESGEASPP